MIANRSNPETSKRIDSSIFRSPTFQALTIGVPFCIFKLLFGVLSIRTGAAYSPIFVYFGQLVITWSAIDLFMYIARVFFDLSGRSPPVEYCT
ncbi:MAG: hypothetical protein L7F78_26435, partial [Syntrophales bacterium LBB04]|nr:hypothetical protein [Syntrophales bacterium LBB04]